MSDIAIRVENLSKQYQLGGQQAAYQTFREALIESASAPLRWLKGERRQVEKFWALDDVSFEVKQGEAVGIIGRNGAGKSTLLKILSSITQPTRGHVELYGRVGSLLEVGTGFHPELTGRENIYLNGAILGMSRQEIAGKFDEIVDFAEVEKFLDTPVKFYSSGMYVRLAFAVAAHLEPEILVVDEVLAVGDTVFQKKCLSKMGAVAQEGRTVLFVSHNMGAVQRLCSRAILLDQGGIHLEGDVSEVIQAYVQMGLKRGGERKWEIHDAPGSDVVKLQAVRILREDDRVSTSFTVRDPVFIEIEYCVLQEGIPLDVYCFLYNEMGVCVFVSIDNKDSPWQNTARPKGLYRNVCQIPGDFLNTGQYFVHTYISQNLDRRIMHAQAKDVVTFSISDSMDEDGARGNFPYQWPSSVIRPRLHWSVELIKNDSYFEE